MIQENIELVDRFTAPLNNIINAMNVTISTFETMQRVSGTSMDTNAIEGARAQLRNATLDIMSMREELQSMGGVSVNPIITPVVEAPEVPIGTPPKMPITPVVDPVQMPELPPVRLPVEWETPQQIEVFNTTGLERYCQEIDATRQMLTQLRDEQRQIDIAADQTDVLSLNAIADIRQINDRVSMLRQSVIEINKRKIDVGGSTAANSQMEGLRQKLSQVLRDQRSLNVAVRQMDVSRANTAYAQLASSVSDVQMYIRDNINGQERFNSAISQGSVRADRLGNTIGRYIRMFVSAFALKKGTDMTDIYASNNARLGLINDGLQTQAELQDRIYASAQRSRGAYNDMVASVAKLGLLAKDAFNSNNETIAFTELVQKSFAVGGASQQEQSAGMYQLTQAMASGKLQGDEFRSIMENAPMIAQAIAQYTGKGMASLKDLSSEGAITADVIKNAMFMASDDINAKFESLPLTFGSVWTRLSNYATISSRHIMQTVNNALNSDVGRWAIEKLQQGIVNLANVVDVVINGMMTGIGWVKDNWEGLIGIIGGVVAAVATYTVATKIATITTGAWNAVLNANPCVMIITVILGVVAALVSWVKAVGGVEIAWLTFQNTMINIWNRIVLVATMFKNATLDAWDEALMAGNRFIVGFQNGFSGVKVWFFNLIQDMVNWGIDKFNWLLTQINRLPWFEFVMLDEASFGDAIAQTEHLAREEREAALASRIAELSNNSTQRYNDLMAREQQMASDAAGREAEIALLRESLKKDDAGTENTWESLVSQIAMNTSTMADSMDMSEEDLKYLRDIAERDVVNRFTTAEIKLDMTNHNTISSNMDVDGIVDEFEERLIEVMNSAAEGVYT